MPQPSLPTPDLSKALRAAEGPAYVAIGLGVLGFQRAQVYRRALQERAAPVRQGLNDLASDAVQHLPEPARDLLDALGRVVTELPAEASALASEAVAIGRFALHAASAPASRLAARQSH